ncbi:putative Mg2+ transporter-C (MgtC) family protein [Ancylobacter sp. 3268]|uniref:MgtC/SapB family protein n=1 Tax=Ancylobacter sp. 3268 TaxID=2817752 RepID=UPI00285552A1|nr:MgtC/SapB family protein [Ancylobacter sp. 3268]MDR6953754.1 putative Mg2+ transporter-C (MgtC) family protein [Ancylobacter sp. 3268]
MPFIASFQLGDFASTLISLVVAFVLGTLIGAERQYRQRIAGLRTNVLVAIGACQFVDMAMHLDGAGGAVRVIAYVVSGIGFLGAGVIMKDGANVSGLNTAATLWCSAAVGACAGADLIAQSVALTVFVLAGNTLLRPLVRRLERLPQGEETEASYEVILLGAAAEATALQARLAEQLEEAAYPAADIEAVERPNDMVEITARLVSTTARRTELDALAARLRGLAGVSSAHWFRSAGE